MERRHFGRVFLWVLTPNADLPVPSPFPMFSSARARVECFWKEYNISKYGTNSLGSCFQYAIR